MQKTPTLSVAMIVKNEEQHLAKTLESLKNIYDQLVIVDTGSTDKTKDIAKEFNAEVYDLKLDPFHFGDARNFSFSKCTGDWILWLDADDVIENPDQVKEMIEALPSTVDAVAVDYLYAFDHRGLCTAKHMKERLIKNNGSLTWQGVLHEAMIPTRKVTPIFSDRFVIRHDKSDADHKKSALRNYTIISKWIEEEGGDNTDPRNLLSLANACLGLDMFEEAIKWFDKFTKRSGWDEEVYIALHRIAVCARRLNHLDLALEFEFKALELLPNVKDAYLGLAETYHLMGKEEKAEHWTMLSFAKRNQAKATVYNPSQYEFQPYWLLANIYINMATAGKGFSFVTKALEMLDKCSEILGSDDKEIAKRRSFLQEEVERTKLAEAVVKVGAELKNEDEEKFKLFTTIIPKLAHPHPVVAKMRNSVDIKTETSGKDITIFCGACFEEWDGNSLDQGVGGSEEAVIHMAKRLVNRGWNVEVYNGILEPKEIDGVHYKPWWEFNQQNATDVFIAWRQPAVFDVLKPNSKKNYLWIHDMIQAGEFTQDRLEKVDKVMFLSKPHRNFFPNVPEEKVMYTSNGIDLSMLEVDAKDVERKPWKMIYTSSPDRGLLCLLKMWPKIKEKYPEAEFYWYYGWQTFDAHNQGNLERMSFKKQILDLLNQEGVHEGGRIDHHAIAKEMASSSLWVYPTEFIETSCITAMKAQALGCIPVTTDVGALSETVRHGVKLKHSDIYSNAEAQEDFIRQIGIAHETAQVTREVMQKDAEVFSWDKVAESWEIEFNYGSNNSLSS